MRIAKRVSRNQGFPPPLVRAGRRGASFVPPDGRRGGFRDGRDGGGFLPDGWDGLTGGLGFLVGGLGLGGRRPGGRGPILELNGLLLSVTFCATLVFRVLDCRSQAVSSQAVEQSAVENVLCMVLSAVPTSWLLFIPDVRAALSSGFFQQADVTDYHGSINGFDHVIESQGSHRYCGEGLHLNARFAR